MRTFTDGQQRVWDITVGKESYGALVLIFALRQGDEIRQAPVDAETAFEADQQLRSLDEETLGKMLDEAPPWEAEPPLGG